MQLELFNKEELQIKEGESKVCIDCNLEKHVSAFPPYNRNADNLDNRGWLCDHCNLAIGLLGDDVKGVTKALDYLKEGNLTLGAT